LLALLLAALAMFAVQLVAPASAGASLDAGSGLTAGYDWISFSYDEVLVPVGSESARHVGPQAHGASQVPAVGSVFRSARNIYDISSIFVAPSGVHTADLIDGPLWTSTKKSSSAGNALRHFNDHGADFPDVHNAMDCVSCLLL
jgi:hypothetical protein